MTKRYNAAQFTSFHSNKMPYKRFTVLSTAALVAACASTVSVDDLRSANKFTKTVEVAKSYDDVYRTVLSQSRRCFEKAVPGATVAVHGDLYSDKKMGEIVVSGVMYNASVAEIVFDIKAKDAASSVVTASYVKQGNAPAVNALPLWLNGDTKTCYAEQKI